MSRGLISKNYMSWGLMSWDLMSWGTEVLESDVLRSDVLGNPMSWDQYPWVPMFWQMSWGVFWVCYMLKSNFNFLLFAVPKWLMLKLPLTPTPPKLPLPLTLMLDTPLLTLPTLMSPLWPSRPLKSILPLSLYKIPPSPLN